MDFSRTLERLLEADTPFEPGIFYTLSDLEPESMERLAAVWPSISADRRLMLVKELVEITETNFEVDFGPIFRWGLLDSDPRVRAVSIEGLWEKEDLALMNELLHMVREDPAEAVRAAAALSLGRFILLSELGKLPSERCRSVYETLRGLVRADTEALQVRRRALEAVAYVTNDGVVELLQQAYDHPDEKMRVSAVFGMGRSADARWIGTVAGELFSVNPEMRYEAARACGELEARAAVSRLAELIDDPDREVQEAALWALGQVGGDEARAVLQSCCDEEDEVVRTAAEAALEELEFYHGQFDFPFYVVGDDEADASL
jgi:HEAT repeat protein